jgi:uncharacterized protein (TIGR02118 family)
VPVRLIALYQAPADPEAFDRHYHEVHTSIVLRYPRLREMRLANVEPMGERSTPYYLMSQMVFDSREDLDAAMASEAGIESARDLRNFAQAGVAMLVQDDDSTTVVRPGASGAPASGAPASGAPASGGPASGGPASGGPASGEQR